MSDVNTNISRFSVSGCSAAKLLISNAHGDINTLESFAESWRKQMTSLRSNGRLAEIKRYTLSVLNAEIKRLGDS